MFEVGETIAGKYRVERMLGQGGMGAVYAAEHLLLHQRVAIKVIASEAAGAAHRERFLREARAASRVRSEHVTQVFDVGELPDGTIFMVLELLDGLDFAKLCEERGLPAPEDAVLLVLEALLGVAAAHASGVIHRDLKLENLFVARRPNGTRVVKVLDFGISKSLGEATSLTASGAMVGSPYSMSPEQIRDSKGVDARSDVWSMGVVLYLLLAGAPPFLGADVGAVIASILEAKPRSILEQRPEVDARLEAVVLRALAKDRDARFADVAELADALVPFGGQRARTLAGEVRRALGTMGVATVEPISSATPTDPALLATAASGAPRMSLALAPTTESNPGVAAAPEVAAPGGTLGGVPIEPAKRPSKLVWIGVAAGVAVASIVSFLALKHADTSSAATNDLAARTAMPSANASIVAVTSEPSASSAASSSSAPSSAPVVTVAASASPFDAGARAPGGPSRLPSSRVVATATAATSTAPASTPPPASSPAPRPATDPLFDQGRQ